MKKIQLKGVKQNNLKDIDVEIPLGSFVVVCGPSGSGKSSLAFQSLFAEGQRRYLESLSNYAKQFVGRAAKPLMDSAKNIPPSIALEQKNSIKSSRSTVGTHSEIYDFLRLFFARLGQAYCPTHNVVMESYDPSKATDRVFRDLMGKRLYMLCKLQWSTAKDAKVLREKSLQEGYYKVLSFNDKGDFETLDLETESLPPKSLEHFLVMDRLIVDEDSEVRIFDAVSQSYSLSFKFFGQAHAQVYSTDGDRMSFKKSISCHMCDEVFWEIRPELFSFNNPVGACPDCNGFGNTLSLDRNKVIPNPSLSIKDGAILPFSMPSGKSDQRALIKYCKEEGVSVDKPWKALAKHQRDLIWDGDGGWYGVKGLFDYLERKKYKMHVRVFLSRFKSSQKCKLCDGKRLDKKLYQVKIAGKDIGEVSSLPIDQLAQWIRGLNLTEDELELTKEVRLQILDRLDFLNQIGLSYISLLRQTRTLSGGEFQRLNISKQLGTELSDTLYVLDEPTIGLHPRDNDRLISLLHKLHKNKNTVVVVEHDRDVILNAERVVEIGPESGMRGGEIIFSGELKDFLKSKSLTTSYLNGDVPSFFKSSRSSVKGSSIQLKGCTGHNLKNIDFNLPLQKFVCVTGVSGSGKSSLVTQSFLPALKEHLTGALTEDSLPYASIKVPKAIHAVDYVDQKRISKSKRSLVSTYLKIFDVIRKRLASEKQAKVMGYTAGSFSLNTEGGRCPQCKGLGVEEVDMLFMDNVDLVCEACDGIKYTKEILQIKYQGKSVVEILDMTCSEALEFFKGEKPIVRNLETLESLGLGYLKLGQSLDTLSGGESQRLKLAQYLLTTDLKGKVLIFDEPSTGLHFNEVTKLINVFNQLVDAGASLVVIEHNLDIIASSDWVIDVGPDAGDAGGQLNLEGRPEDICKKKGYTAQYLKQHMR